MNTTTPQQKAWFDEHPNYVFVGPPSPHDRYIACGTLYADGSFVPLVPMKPIELRPGCVCVGILVHANR